MSLSNVRSNEPLYIVIVREKNAQQLLQSWAKSLNVQVSIDANRMKIYDLRTLHLFQLNWKTSWENVSVWDCWLKRHVYHHN